VFKLFPSAQLVPFHSSEAVLLGLSPPEQTAAVDIPNPAGAALTVFKSASSVQDVPL